MGMDFRGLVWKRVWKMTCFLVWNVVRIWESGGKPLLRIPRSTIPQPPLPHPEEVVGQSKIKVEIVMKPVRPAPLLHIFVDLKVHYVQLHCYYFDLDR